MRRESRLCIQLIDSGHRIMKSLEQECSPEVQSLDARFVQLPEGAIQARLVGVWSKGPDWSGGAIQWFNSSVHDKSLVSEVRGVIEVPGSNTYVLELELWDTSAEDDRHIGREMVERGLACRRPQNSWL